MLFNSHIFIFLFMPIVLALYFFIGRYDNRRISNAFLLFSSLVFIFYGLNFIGLFSIIVSIAVNFSIYKLILSYKDNVKNKNVLLAIGVVINSGTLILLKYYNTFVYHIDKFRNVDFVEIDLILPLGISFYTFQQIAFLVDAYRGEVEECSLLDYSLYVSYFPRVISGPIISHEIFIPQIKSTENLKFNWENFNKGLYRFAVGLAKKVLIADVLAAPAAEVFTNPECYFAFNSLIGALAYTLEIYFDFSGYCDMAIGISKMLNIDIPENFDSPYKATNIKDFWGRWHITLTNFLTKYIYIPLGGSRKGTLRTYVNIMVIFIISGIWHGSGQMKPFLIWGFAHGVAMVVYRLFKKYIDRWNPVFGWLVTFTFVSLAWVPFGISSTEKIKAFFANLFNLDGLMPIPPNLEAMFKTPGITFLENNVAKFDFFTTRPYLYPVMFLMMTLIIVLNTKNAREVTGDFKPSLRMSLLTVLLLVWSIISISEVGTFIYAGF